MLSLGFVSEMTEEAEVGMLSSTSKWWDSTSLSRRVWTKGRVDVQIGGQSGAAADVINLSNLSSYSVVSVERVQSVQSVQGKELCSKKGGIRAGRGNMDMQGCTCNYSVGTLVIDSNHQDRPACNDFTRCLSALSPVPPSPLLLH